MVYMLNEPSSSVRRATEDDIREVDEIYKVTFLSRTKPNYQIFLENRNCLFYVATINDKIAGFIIAIVEGEVGHILLLAVHPNFRRRGLGTALLKHTLSELKRRGVKKVYLEVGTSNIPAINLYKKLGFKIKDLRFDHFMSMEGNVDDVYVMEKNLEENAHEDKIKR